MVLIRAMKYLFAFILSFTVLYSCNKKVSQPIVDYPANYEDSRRLRDLSSVIKQRNQHQNEQTVVLIGNKEYSFEKFKELVKKDEIESIKKIIKDSVEIQQLNYPYKKIKTIIIATKK